MLRFVKVGKGCYAPAMSQSAQEIHNFCIIAHIDHGKSTLADRMLEMTGTVESRDMKEQMLDSMELERERGITIKLQPVRMEWRGSVLNLIDTPGHVDFQYEVSRSLQAVEGAVLLVDATQGVQAQTIANVYLAIEQNLTIIPVINKIDLPAANVTKVAKEIVDLLGVESDDILHISAKTGQGVEAVLEAVVDQVPVPRARDNLSSAGEQVVRALVFDSVYDDYKGVVAYVRMVDGEIATGDSLVFLGTGASDRVVETGVFAPAFKATGRLRAGEIGYIATGLKNVQEARVGDTITLAKNRELAAVLPGFTIPQPKVFAGIYPAQGDQYAQLREAIEKLTLNDASLVAQAEQSEALGQGYRCGFLGILHLEIVQERLSREWNLDLVVTIPSVKYRVKKTGGEVLDVHTPAAWPDPSVIESCSEQFVQAEVIFPTEYMGAVFEVMKQHEGELKLQEHLGEDRLMIKYSLPLRELVVDLYDQLKSATAGYGSLSYELGEWKSADVVKLSMLVNHEPVEAMSLIAPRTKAASLGRRMVERLKEVLPKQLFAVPIQAAVGGTIVARETLPAMRKDVTGHLYGGDVTRKKKLLAKQKKGKKKLAGKGTVDIPAEAYIALFRR